MSDPTKTDLDEEMSPTVSYDLSVVVPHMSIDTQHRRVIREIFEQAAQLLRMKLSMAEIDPHSLRATRWSSDYKGLDLFGQDTPYPEE